MALFRANGPIYESPGQRPDEFTHLMIAGPRSWSRQRPHDGSRGVSTHGWLVKMRLRRGAMLETGDCDPGPPHQASRRDAITSRPWNRGLKPTATFVGRSATGEDPLAIQITRGIIPPSHLIETHSEHEDLIIERQLEEHDDRHHRRTRGRRQKRPRPNQTESTRCERKNRQPAIPYNAGIRTVQGGTMPDARNGKSFDKV